jgi:cell division protein FtsB
MEEYLIHNFEDHPSIAAENVCFLTYNMMGAGGSNADVDAKQLEKQVDKLETSNKNLRTQLDKLGSRIEKLEKK